MRIGIAGLSHETNTFAVEQNRTMDDVRMERGEALLSRAHPRSFIGGFAEGAGRADVELVPTVGIGFAQTVGYPEQILPRAIRRSAFNLHSQFDP